MADRLAGCLSPPWQKQGFFIYLTFTELRGLPAGDGAVCRWGSLEDQVRSPGIWAGQERLGLGLSLLHLPGP